MLGSGSLAQQSDFKLGALRVRPARRLIEGPLGSVAVEPLVMQLLVELSRNAGNVLTLREIFERCWGSEPVGDDSLNRIVAGLRKALAESGDGIASVETVPRTGYILRFNLEVSDESSANMAVVQTAIEEAVASLRLGLPEPDMLRLEMLRQAVVLEPANAAAWGTLALLCRYAAEYADAPRNSAYVHECEASANRALAVDATNSNAQVALATVAPLFGRWADARARLTPLCEGEDRPFAAVHEFSIVEMATGRLEAAKGLVCGLLKQDPLAACLYYKSIYHHWSTGDLATMDHLADRAIQLWPAHPAIWTARLWTLAFTGRAHAALAMVNDTKRPEIPAPALGLLRSVLVSVASGDSAAKDAAGELSSRAAKVGPAQAIAALFALGLLERTDQQVAVAYAYYLREGATPVPVRHMADEPSINDQHRRVTQILFTPACAALRSHPAFGTLCERTGLSDYWATSGLQPDFATDGNGG